MVFLVLDTARLLRNKLDQAAQGSGLTSAQWRVLAFVGRCQQLNMRPLNQAELADMLDVEPITLSRQIDRLAAMGLIERRPDPADRRAYRLHLTGKAKPLVASFREASGGMVADALEGFDEEDINRMIDLLLRVQTNLSGKGEITLPAVKTETKTKESA